MCNGNREKADIKNPFEHLKLRIQVKNVSRSFPPANMKAQLYYTAI